MADLMNIEHFQVGTIAGKTGKVELQRIGRRGVVGERQRPNVEELEMTLLFSEKHPQRKSGDVGVVMASRAGGVKKLANLRHGRLSTSHLYGP
jgi:hypothetical protein